MSIIRTVRRETLAFAALDLGIFAFAVIAAIAGCILDLYGMIQNSTTILGGDSGLYKQISLISAKCASAHTPAPMARKTVNGHERPNEHLVSSDRFQTLN